MKLNPRQKKILLTFSLIFFLTILIMTSVFLLANKDSNKKPTNNPSPTPSLPNNNQNLIEVRNQTVSEIESELNSKNIQTDQILAQLKTNYGLETNSISWKNYLIDDNQVNSIEELEKRKANILNVINALVEGPSGPSGPSPSTPPTNKWERILWEVKKFLDAKPSSDKIQEWGKNKENEIGDPLLGIDLKGANKSILLALNRGSGEREIERKAIGKAEIWKNSYVSLSSAGDGNCFLNSFAILLTGSQERDSSKEKPNSQENVATRLRVALCLNLMKAGDNNTADFNDLKDFAENHKALNTDQARHLCKILKRPIIIIHKDDGFAKWAKSPEMGGILRALYIDEKGEIIYKEPFVIYHVGSFHFEPLVQKNEHEDGIISFNYSQVDFEDENNSNDQRSIVFTLNPDTLKKEYFSATHDTRINSFFSKNKVRVLFNKNSESVKKDFERIKEANLENNGKTKKTNKNVVIDIVKPGEISSNTNEIIISYESFFDVNLTNNL